MIGFLGIALSLSQAATPARLPVHIGGRVVEATDHSLSFGWPGVYLESRFRGTAVRTRFDTGDNFLRLLIDGKEVARFERTRLVDRTVSGLKPGNHVIRLEKLTESATGGTQFYGFYPVGRTVALTPPDRSRKIEFIGDSYTVGYGNTSPSRECTETEVHDRTDTSLAFGPLVAHSFDADYRIIAYSGRGVVRNYGGAVPGQTMVWLYPRAQPDDAQHRSLSTVAWKPQIIVVNLGTNDFSTKLTAEEKWPNEAALRVDYQKTYMDFIRSLHERQPQARFILMASDDFLTDVKQVAEHLNRGGTLATVVGFGGLALTGCNWHPSLADDRKMAGLLEPAIRQLTGWK